MMLPTVATGWFDKPLKMLPFEPKYSAKVDAMTKSRPRTNQELVALRKAASMADQRPLERAIPDPRKWGGFAEKSTAITLAQAAEVALGPGFP